MANILVVDDMQIMRDIVRATLEPLNHAIFEAENGEDGLTLIQEQRIDLIITDLYMDGMDGIEFTAAVRHLAEYKFTPILLLTGENSSEIKFRGKKAGVTGWLLKPFEPEKLKSALARLIS